MQPFDSFHSKSTPAATLTAQTEDGVRVLTVDCPHGTTTVAYANGTSGPQITDAAVARLALVKHFAEEGCRCTESLRGRLAHHAEGATLTRALQEGGER